MDRLVCERQANSNFKTMRSLEEIFSEELARYVKESFGVGLNSFPISSNQCTNDTDLNTEEILTTGNEKCNNKKESTTPRSNKLFSTEGYRYERKEENTANQHSTDATESLEKPNQSSVNRKTSNPTGNGHFKIKCNLRVFVPIDRNARLTNRRVYTMDCNKHCKKYASTQENPNGRFENCYESSWPELYYNFDDHYNEKCYLRVLLKVDSNENRRVCVRQCSGDCGKFCESRKPCQMLGVSTQGNSKSNFESCHESSWLNCIESHEICGLKVSLNVASSQNRRVFLMRCCGSYGKFCECHKSCKMFDEYLEFIDSNSYAITLKTPNDYLENDYESSFPCWLESYYRDDYHYNKKCDLRVIFDVTSFHNRQVFVLW